MNNLEKYGLQQRFLNEAASFAEYEPGRIISQYRGKFKVAHPGGEALAELSGKLRHALEEAGDLAFQPVVGDFVMVSLMGEDGRDGALIQEILSRKSLFVRRAVGVTEQAQPVAANADIAFLCMSLNQNYSLNRMERYLSIAWDSGAAPVIVLTKADLCGDLEDAVAEVERISCFSDVISLSKFDDDEIVREKFRKYFEKNQTCVFIGSSGVGKTTLINKLLGGARLATAETGRDDKGRHTTTGREIYPCPLGGAVMDTPGMREMGAESIDAAAAFADIDDLAAGCKFRDCTHTGEPGCAVLAAVKDGSLEARRLENYRKLMTEAGYEGLGGKALEQKKLERMFKDVGGIKGMRKSMRERNKRR